jgi:hypothetical protein
MPEEATLRAQAWRDEMRRCGDPDDTLP